jgi:hypothetical protein
MRDIVIWPGRWWHCWSHGGGRRSVRQAGGRHGRWRQRGEPVTAGPVVDSIFPIEEELRRFRATLAEHPQALDETTPSREALVARFVAALEATDTAELRRMALTRAEFAYLYYPTTQFAQPPYELNPALVWYRLESYSSRGLVRALDRFGGRPLRVTGHACDAAPLVQGGNRIWHGCVLHARDAADRQVSLSLFGPVLEGGKVQVQAAVVRERAVGRSSGSGAARCSAPATGY